jgi:hypothetical protein
MRRAGGKGPLEAAGGAGQRSRQEDEPADAAPQAEDVRPRHTCVEQQVHGPDQAGASAEKMGPRCSIDPMVASYVS